MNASPPLASESCEQHKAHGFHWILWLAHLVGKPGVKILELGTWQGEWSEWLLEHVATHDSARVWAVDTFEGSAEHRLAGVDCAEHERQTRERLARFGHRAQIFKGLTNEVLRGFLRDDRFDAIYVDAAHDAMNVLRDSVLAFDLLNVGGILVWDDYEWTVMEQEVDRPRMAIDAFLACYARRVEVISVGWQVAIRKTA